MSYNSLYIVLLLYISSIFCSIRIAPDPCTQLDNYLQQLTPKTVTYNKCRNTSTVANFNPLGISGKWYLYQMYNFANDMIDLTCSTDNFVQAGNVLNYTGLFIFKNGTILPLIQNQFPLSQFRTGEITFPAFGLDLKVVDTDYNSYILWHACYTDTKSGSQFERVVLATRSLAPVSDAQDAQFDRLIAQKIFNNVSPIQIPPYGRCNCYRI